MHCAITEYTKIFKLGILRGIIYIIEKKKLDYVFNIFHSVIMCKRKIERTVREIINLSIKYNRVDTIIKTMI